MNDYLISIRPQWMAKIHNGTKIIEIRKTIPKELQNGHPCTFWGYCTKARSAKEWLVRCLDDVWRTIGTADGWVFSPDTIHFDGLVVCKFMVEKANKLKWGRWVGQEEWNYRGWNYEHDELLNHTCLSNEQLNNYGDGKPIYALHITALEIIEPLALGAFQSEQITGRYDTGVKVRKWLPITKAPQSWCRVIPPIAEKGKP